MRNTPFAHISMHRLSRRELLHRVGVSGVALATTSLARPLVLPAMAAGIPDRETQAQIKAIINQYFTLKYETRKANRVQDFEALLANTPQAQAFGKAERSRRDLEAFQASLFDLRYSTYTFTLDYTDLTLNADATEAVATIQESNRILYNGATQSSRTAVQLPHRLALKKVGPAWRIVQDDYSDEWQRYLKRGGLSEDQIKDRSKALKETNEKAKATRPSSVVVPLAPGDPRAYDAGAAVQYAYDWTGGVGNRNVPPWGDYGPNEFTSPNHDDPGNDCTNFSNQCIKGGGAPEDLDGNYTWFWYSDSYYAGSWLSVTQQWDYLYNNGLPLPDRQGPGPWGQEVSVWDAYPGDIVQFDYGRGEGWSHSPLIVRKDGVDLSQIGVAAHSYTVYNKAISDYPIANERWMHIKGYGSTI